LATNPAVSAINAGLFHYLFGFLWISLYLFDVIGFLCQYRSWRLLGWIDLASKQIFGCSAEVKNHIKDTYFTSFAVNIFQFNSQS